jgi:predicted unusual protein kinase regulating ubiquinone biosynthesis (AarF/ABC1/UbiB family)
VTTIELTTPDKLATPETTVSKPARSYDSYRWSRNDYTQLGRFIEIGRVALTFLFYLWLDQKLWSYGTTQPLSSEQKARRYRQRAIWIRENLLHLGPTFIKIGQFFSTRADLFPPEYIDELSKLQDQVPAFDYDQAANIIEEELGRPVEQVYASFTPVPIASASLGQVHYAQLDSGAEVAVKVQRPGLQRLFTIDLGILRSIAEFVQYRTPWGKGGRDWIGIYQECYTSLFEELNYLNEGRNANIFRRNFQEIPEVVVPRVHWRYTTPRVMTMEYIPGIKVNDLDALAAAGVDRISIADIGATSYLRQVLHHGFFHADPHPGNLAVDVEGRMIFYDFGMMGRIPPMTKDKLMLNFRGILNKDANLVVQSMVALGALAPDSDLGPVRRSVQFMLDSYFDQALDKKEAVSVASINDDLYQLTYNQPFRFPAEFTFVLRSLSALEALGKFLNPKFNFMDVAQPFAEEIMAQGTSETTNIFLEQFTRQATEFTNTSLNLPQHLETTLNQLEQGDLKMRVNSVELNRELRQLNTLSVGIIYTLLSSTLTLSATQFFLKGWPQVGGVALGGATLAALSLIRLLLFKLDRSVS